MNFNEIDKLSPQIQEEATSLMTKVAEACKGHDPAIMMLVLEVALGEAIRASSGPIADLFNEMMGEFKSRAAMLLMVMRALGKTNNAGDEESGSLESLISDLKAAASKPEESPSGESASKKA